jgi:hypothetical protein
MLFFYNNDVFMDPIIILMVCIYLNSKYSGLI